MDNAKHPLDFRPMYVSILITTYNAEKYILSTLNSIINQTDHCFEVVLVDDGSTDHTLEMVNNYIYIHNLNNFRVITLAHIGRVGALKHAVSAAQYDWGRNIGCR